MTQRDFAFDLIPRARRSSGTIFGDVPSRDRGSGVEIEEARPFQPGDDPRYIDQIATAWAESINEDEEPVFRERRTEVVLRVILAVDRRSSMAPLPETFGNFLRKPLAVEIAGRMIVASVLRKRGYAGFLDYAHGARFWRAPNLKTETWKVNERYLPHRHFRAPEDTLERMFFDLSRTLRDDAPEGSMLFVLSDFFVLPSPPQWRALLRRGLDVVPVLVQDPVFEQSFPLEAVGNTLVVEDPSTGGTTTVRLTKSDARRQRRHHEERLAAALRQFRSLDLDWVLLSHHEPREIYREFSAWAGTRKKRRWHQ